MSEESSGGTLSNLSREERRFEPPAELAENANLKQEAYDRAAADPEAFWAEQAERLDWDQKWDRVLDWDDPPFAKWFVGGRINAAYNCVDRHVANGLGDRVAINWVGEPEDDTRTVTYAELKDEVCKAANALTDLGVAEGRPGRDLHADDPRDRRRDAGLRTDRGAAHGGLRRLLLRRARVPGRRLRRQGDHHLRRRLPPRLGLRPQAGRRRGAHQGRGAGRQGREGPGRQAHRPGRRVGRRRRRVVARHRRPGIDRARVRVLRLRAPALRHVHLRLDRQAQGDPAHDRWLPDRCGVHALGGLRPQAGDRRLLVHRRCRLGDRPQLPGLRTARQRHDAGALRGHAGQPREGPLVEDHRGVQGLDLLHRADRDPLVHEAGSRDPRQVRPVLGAAARLGR